MNEGHPFGCPSMISCLVSGSARLFLGAGHRAARLARVVLVAPVAQRLFVEQVVQKPGRLLLVADREQGLAADWVDANDAESLQLVEGVGVGGTGAAGLLLGLLLRDEGGGVGPTAAAAQLANAAAVAAHLEP